jgi:hypothetical protein
MKTREQIQSSMQSALIESRKRLNDLKGDVEAAGDAVSLEMRNSLAEAEKLWELGQAKYRELTAVSDARFEEIHGATVAHWEELSAWIDSGWSNVRERLTHRLS